MRTWRRFRALNAADRGLILEAATWLCVVRGGISTIPFLTLRRALANLSARFGALEPRASAQRVAWAVTAAARHLPFRSTCLIESLAAHAMLQRRGIVSDLRLGVRRPDGPASLAAHAWVEHDGAVVLGELDDLREYGELR